MKAKLPLTKAARIAMLIELGYPIDEDGNPMEPLFTEEQIRELLNGRENTSDLRKILPDED